MSRSHHKGDDSARVAREIEAIRRQRSGTRSFERDASPPQDRRAPATGGSIGGMLRAFEERAGKTHRRLGRLIEIWSTVLPPELVRHTTVRSVRSGVLYVGADSAAVAYEIDRLLREGLIETLRRRFEGTLTRVRITIATESPAAG